ncbi:hypothetical protein H632_c1020p0 [Helicosporidium sp. ATCC 50920]|nr:hypothetical protein H632_c1020p0 [Helicosporidium sp. ATCC 50920]|eukprot:KDD74871.1 hypothetical protein H632_c1020p0 [Helicosporidium sp. ATCC 50920]
MYTFVFLWTPALAPSQESLPHGAIFACFMVSSMVGSALVGRLLAPGTGRRVERYMQAVFVASAACLLVPVFVHSGGTVQTVDPATGGLALWGRVQLAAFCCFELLVGMFWPSMMTMRSAHVPEEMRSTVINIFRVPLNLFVCLVMYNVEAVPLSHMFAMCVAFLLLCAACQNRFAALVARGKAEEQGAQMVEVAVTA